MNTENNSSPHHYYILYKPYGIVSQFISSHAVPLLGDLNFNFPEGIHAIGRLDRESEGLLILTTNKKITKLLFESKIPHERSYLVQVDHTVSAASLHRLRTGLPIKIKNAEMYTTPPCKVQIVEMPEKFCIIDTHINKGSPIFTWILITLTEGKFHQVRKMMTAIRHKTKRLIRVSIENLVLDDLKPGELREVPEEIFMQKLKINYR